MQAIIDNNTYYVGGVVRAILTESEFYNDIDLLVSENKFNQIPKLIPKAKYVETNNIYFFDNVEVASYVDLEKDLAQRDFTINAIAVNAKNGSLVDPYNGREDIHRKQIHALNENIFKADPLRIYRAARIASETGFEITPKTLELMAEAHDFSSVPPERVSNELIKALNTEKPSIFFNYLKKTDCLKYHFPEIQSLVGVPQPIKYHHGDDVYEHSMKVLDKVTTAPVRFSALCHDIGKGATLPEKYPHHYDHDAKGPELITNLARRLHGVPVSWINAAKFVAKEHMRARTMSKPGKIATLYQESEKTCIGFDGLLEVVDADDGTDSIISIHRDMIKKTMQSKISYPPDLHGKEVGDYILQRKVELLSNQLRQNKLKSLNVSAAISPLSP